MKPGDLFMCVETDNFWVDPFPGCCDNPHPPGGRFERYFSPGDIFMFICYEKCKCNFMNSFRIALFLTQRGITGEHCDAEGRILWTEWKKCVKEVSQT
jgi:hypothetical protein